MVHRLQRTLDDWRDDADVEFVLIDGAGGRGLCAGGDVRLLREQILSGRLAEVAGFFRAEYLLNATIAEYPKPVVALADGITMGGGVGVACHTSVRIVTERSRLAMPETRIGFTADVGGSWLLAHAPGRLGEYLALTGETMDAADAIHAGFADRLIPVDRLADIAAVLGSGGPDGLASLSEATTGPSRLAAAAEWIDEAFAADTVANILHLLDARPEPAAAATAALLRALPPTALTVALAAVRRARELPDLRAALAQEYGLVMWFAQTQPDLVEGIRAQLVDKDRSPRWVPAALSDVPDDTLERAFAFVPEVPLWP